MTPQELNQSLPYTHGEVKYVNDELKDILGEEPTIDQIV